MAIGTLSGYYCLYKTKSTGISTKNPELIEERGVSFEEIVFSLQSGCLLDDVVHPNKEKYARQRVFIVAIDDYVYLVPYVERNLEESIGRRRSL